MKAMDEAVVSKGGEEGNLSPAQKRSRLPLVLLLFVLFWVLALILPADAAVNVAPSIASGNPS